MCMTGANSSGLSSVPAFTAMSLGDAVGTERMGDPHLPQNCRWIGAPLAVSGSS
jgi:hypothetical protein